MRQIQSIHSKVTEHLVRYILSYACNYHCKDCYQSERSRIIPQKEHIHNIAMQLNKLLSCFNDDIPITLYLEGGEISLFDIINDVLSYIDNPNVKTLKIVTNLSAPVEYYEELKSYCIKKDYNFRLLASLHLEQCLPAAFFEKVTVLNPNSVLVVVDNQNYLEYKKYLDYMREKRIFFNLTHKKYDQAILPVVKEFIQSYTKDIHQERYEVTYDDGSKELKEAFEIEEMSDWSFIAGKFYCTHRRDITISPDGMLTYYGCGGQLGNILYMNDARMKRLNFGLDVCLGKGHCNWKCANYHIERIDK